MTTVLTQKRGEPFKYRFTFGNGWIGPMFTGGVRFTVRTRIPGSDVPDDTDDGVVYAAKSMDPDPEITFEEDGEVAYILIPASSTRSWPRQTLYADVQAAVDGDPESPYKPDDGYVEIKVTGDITRTPP